MAPHPEKTGCASRINSRPGAANAAPGLGVDKVNTLRKNEIFIFSSCIIFLSPSVTAGRRPRLRGWRFEDGPKGPAEPEPQPGEAEVGARRKMIKEAATWAAPTARRQNLRFCRPRSPLATWKPKGLPTLRRTCRRCGLNMKELRPLHASPNEENMFVNALDPARQMPRRIHCFKIQFPPFPPGAQPSFSGERAAS